MTSDPNFSNRHQELSDAVEQTESVSKNFLRKLFRRTEENLPKVNLQALHRQLAKKARTEKIRDYLKARFGQLNALRKKGKVSTQVGRGKVDQSTVDELKEIIEAGKNPEKENRAREMIEEEEKEKKRAEESAKKKVSTARSFEEGPDDPIH